MSIATDMDVPCYIGRKSCGCVVYAQVDDPDKREDHAYQADLVNGLAEKISDGLAIEKRTVGYARKNFAICKCKERGRA